MAQSIVNSGLAKSQHQHLAVDFAGLDNVATRDPCLTALIKTHRHYLAIGHNSATDNL